MDGAISHPRRGRNVPSQVTFLVCLVTRVGKPKASVDSDVSPRMPEKAMSVSRPATYWPNCQLYPACTPARKPCMLGLMEVGIAPNTWERTPVTGSMPTRLVDERAEP